MSDDEPRRRVRGRWPGTFCILGEACARLLASMPCPVSLASPVINGANRARSQCLLRGHGDDDDHAMCYVPFPNECKI